TFSAQVRSDLGNSGVGIGVATIVHEDNLAVLELVGRIGNCRCAGAVPILRVNVPGNHAQAQRGSRLLNRRVGSAIRWAEQGGLWRTGVLDRLVSAVQLIINLLIAHVAHLWMGIAVVLHFTHAQQLCDQTAVTRRVIALNEPGNQGEVMLLEEVNQRSAVIVRAIVKSDTNVAGAIGIAAAIANAAANRAGAAAGVTTATVTAEAVIG